MPKKEPKKRGRKPGSTKPPNQVDIFVGERIRVERENQRRTLQDVSEKAGVLLQMLHHYETGNVKIFIQTLVDIARALGRPTRYFLDPRRNVPALTAHQNKDGTWSIEGEGIKLRGKCTQTVADAIVEIGGDDE